VDYTDQEGFKFLGHHTKEYNLILLERSAPTPEEKKIKESVPFMQGDYDFSMILGERIYENRTLTFTFTLFEDSYEYRKVDETALANWLMKGGYEPLYDDHAPNYYYMAKCTSVQVEDNTAERRLIVTITFDAYPFKISMLAEGHDIWDEFNFELDVSQPVEFTVNDSLYINLLNVGSCGVVPTVTASAPMTIRKNGFTYQVPQGESRSESFRLEIGENPMTVKGNGTIKFTFYKELI
jgi:phage-related protein